MDEYIKSGKDYIGYEYKEAVVPHDKVSMYLDAYQNFGWIPDDNMNFTRYVGIAAIPSAKNINKVTIQLKRDRKIINKTELTRLQRHFEACMNEIEELEKSKTQVATMSSIGIGVVGTAFMAGATFAVTADPPIIWLCVILSIPGFIGWILPCFVYKFLVRRRAETVRVLIDQKYDEIYEICEKGSALL